jgi:hypothetical protein
MSKEFIPYEEALDLKKLEFDEPCFGYYGGPKTKHIGLIWYEMSNSGKDTIPVGDVLAPTYSQTFRFFREKYGLHLSINVRDGIWYFERFSTDVFKTYEDAELACLRKLIKIVKNNG